MYKPVLNTSQCLCTLVVLVLFPLLTHAAGRAGGALDVDVVDLRCEYLRNPLGLDVARPRLSWKLVAGDKDASALRQSAYQVIAASSVERVEAGAADLWDSGKVCSSASMQIPYSGTEVSAGTCCWWKVRVWVNDSVMSPWSKPAFWSMGPAEWAGQWIGDAPDVRLHDYLDYVAAHNADADFSKARWANPPVLPSPLLRKVFQLDKPVKRATLYASAIGYYEMWINGKPVDSRLQAPEYTDYDISVQYQTYDITPLLRHGENALAAMLADGWALGRNAGVKWMRRFPHRGFYAPDRRLLAQLEIEFADGTRETVASDDSWKINADGHVLEADNFGGQIIDARRILPGWTEAVFNDSGWKNVTVDSMMPPRALVAQKNEPIRVHESIRPVRIWRFNGKQMVDFGQNIAGHCKLDVRGNRGDTVTIRHGEWINPDGTLYTQSLGYAKATDRFILSGDDDCFEPTFTYHGFQFVEIDGLDGALTADMISAEAVSSDCEITGRFECSNPALNQLYRNIVWTQRNNMFSVLHDNPSRDERTGAAGDVQIFAQSAIFNMDMAAFFTKYMNDFKHLARNGQFFSMIPSLSRDGFWDGWVGAPGWSEAGFIVPWRMYENYADAHVLRELFPYMKSHVEAVLRENPDMIWRVRHNHNGDWLNANTIVAPPDSSYDTRHGATPDDLFATAFLAHAARLLARTAAVIGEDATAYSALADSIKARFITEFVRADGSVEGNTQGAYSLALFFDLVPEHLREKAFEKLLGCIADYDYRLSTGFITTPMMMQLLVDFNHADIAYRLLESTRFPSWLYIVNNGATTVWERWDAWIPGRGFQNDTMNSLDHVAFGAVSEWMFRNIIGINPDMEHPGYERFTLRPRPGGTLTWAQGEFSSPRGLIKSAWRETDGGILFDVTVPANASATLILPAAAPEQVECMSGGGDRPLHFTSASAGGDVAVGLNSGTYQFLVKPSVP